MDASISGPLRGVRVLDLANAMGLYCGKLLGDLGADVIKVEPPGGAPERKIGPFLKGQSHPEKSLYWFHFNTNKRGITLNLHTTDGKELFRKLSARTDVIVETFAPGAMDEMGSVGRHYLGPIPGLSWPPSPLSVKQVHEGLQASDLVGIAVGGLLATCGWPERAPEGMGGSQAYHMASVQAAVGILIALYQRTKQKKEAVLIYPCMLLSL